MKIEIAKAVPHRQEVEDLEIAISGAPPDFGEEWRTRGKVFYEDQARALASALQRTLPGGTFDALLAELCTRKASMLRVAYRAPQEAVPQ